MLDKYTGLAIALIAEFPIGTKLSSEEFDNWAAEQGEPAAPPAGHAKDSDAQLAHVYRRNRLRNKINKKATHPRMRDLGHAPFSLDVTGLNSLEVRAPQTAALALDIQNRLDRYTDTQYETLDRLVGAIDRAALPLAESFRLDGVYKTLERFKRNIKFQIADVDMEIRETVERVKAFTAKQQKQLLDGNAQQPEEATDRARGLTSPPK